MEDSNFTELVKLLNEQEFINEKITINHNLHERVLIERWPINTGLFSPEPSRVSVQKGNVSYSLVLDENPRVEIWNVNDDGEISTMFASVTLPKKR